MQSTILLVALFLPLSANAASPSLRFVSSSGSAVSSYHRVVPLPNGNVLIAGSYGFEKCNLVTGAPSPFFPICGQGQFPNVQILDSSGNPAGNSLAFGGGTGT